MSRIDDIYEAKCMESSDLNEHLPLLKRYASHCKHVTGWNDRTSASTWALIAGKPKVVIACSEKAPTDNHLAEISSVASQAGVSFTFVEGPFDIKPTNLLFLANVRIYPELRHYLHVFSVWVADYIIVHNTKRFAHQGDQREDRGLQPAITDFLAAHDMWVIKEVHNNNNGLTVLERR